MASSAIQVIAAVLSACVGLVLLAAAIHKIRARSRMLQVLPTFASVPRSAAPFVLAVVILLELGCGLALWIPAIRFVGALGATLLWSVYALLLVKAVVTGTREIDCGCTPGASHARLGAPHIVRAIVLAVLAAVVALPRSAAGAYAWEDPWTVLLPALTFFILYSTWGRVLDLQAPSGEARWNT